MPRVSIDGLSEYFKDVTIEEISRILFGQAHETITSGNIVLRPPPDPPARWAPDSEMPQPTEFHFTGLPLDIEAASDWDEKTEVYISPPKRTPELARYCYLCGYSRSGLFLRGDVTLCDNCARCLDWDKEKHTRGW
jgi:hypothetical protein